MLTDQIDGFNAVLALGDNVHVVDCFQEISEFVARQLFIIDDYSR